MPKGILFNLNFLFYEENGKNEELQSRREFFKRAAKGALPILAGAALLSSPILSETANAMSCAGCNNRCMNSCFNTLKSYIYNSVAELRYIKDVLGLADKIKNLSKIYTYARNFLYLGRGYNYPTALEGALKLKEISYIHAEGYPAAEMKHGPIALVDSEMPTVVIAPTDSLYDKIISNVRQVKARGGTVVAIITKGNDAMKDIADHCLEVPDVPECLTPLVVSVPLQLLAYYIAINKDRNVDQPRNLAKSVTVE